MTTKNPRINVTFEASVAGLLAELANHEHKSVSSLVRELALEALELREDINLSKLAEIMDDTHAKTYSHDDAWK
ncbi:MAG: DUF6290 family protein [Gammaproteobacteria bacterium]